MAENPTLATGPQGVGGGLRGSGMGLFLKRWVSNPRRVGAILPSAMHLARIMTHASVEARCGAGPVVELGPGTGSITRALLASGIAEEALVLPAKDFVGKLPRTRAGITALERRAFQSHVTYLREILDGDIGGA